MEGKPGSDSMEKKETLKEESVKRDRLPRGIYGALAFFVTSSLAMIVLSLLPPPAIHVAALGIAALLAAAGLMMRKRWGFLLGLFVLILYVAFGLSLMRALLLFFEFSLTPLTIALTVMIGAFIIATAIVCHYILSKRSFFS
jgi:hypothetical protein